MAAIRIVEYLDSEGRSPYAAWFDGLHAIAAAKERWTDYRRRKGTDKTEH